VTHATDFRYRFDGHAAMEDFLHGHALASS
jgi:hypothetical protein